MPFKAGAQAPVARNKPNLSRVAASAFARTGLRAADTPCPRGSRSWDICVAGCSPSQRLQQSSEPYRTRQAAIAGLGVRASKQGKGTNRQWVNPTPFKEKHSGQYLQICALVQKRKPVFDRLTNGKQFARSSPIRSHQRPELSSVQALTAPPRTGQSIPGRQISAFTTTGDTPWNGYPRLLPSKRLGQTQQNRNAAVPACRLESPCCA